MQLTTVINRLGRNDSRVISRDSFLVGMSLYIFIISIVMRFLLPWANDLVQETDTFNFVLADYYPLIIGYLLYAGSLLAGMVIGFVVLDERDDETLKALMVTPITLGQYMFYRVLVPGVIGLAFVLCMFLIVNTAVPPIGLMILLAIVNGMTASWIMLILANFAQNKVQGFTVVKMLGSIGMVLFAAWFLETPFEYLVGFFPTYWFLKSYWLMLESDPGWITFMLIGIVYNTAVIWLLVKRFEKVAYQ